MRIKEMDIARGFTVLIMPGVHVVLMYGNTTAQASWLGKLFGFLAEGPGAPLFMLLMGMSFSFSKRNTVALTLKRAGRLLVAAYVLNFLKFTVLQMLHVLPEGFIKEYGISNGTKGIWELLLTGDILQFAAIALVLLALINTTKWRYAVALTCVVFFIGISPVSTRMQPNYLLDLFTGEHGLVFFPVFPWLVYPLTGYSIMYLVRKQKGFLYCFYTGAALLCTSIVLSQINHTSLSANFYRSAPAATIYHMGIVLLWFWLCHIAVRLIEPSMLCKLFYWLSKNILSIYIIQWVVVCWLLPVAGYQLNDIVHTILWIVLVTGSSFLIMYIYEQLMTKKEAYAKK